MACGIIKFDNDILIKADKVLYVYKNEDNENDLSVGVEGSSEDLIVNDCTLDRFYDEWRRALTY